MCSASSSPGMTPLKATEVARESALQAESGTDDGWSDEEMENVGSPSNISVKLQLPPQVLWGRPCIF